MKKLLLTMIIEGTAEDINEIKGAIIATASESIITLKADVIEEPKEIKLAPFLNPTTGKFTRYINN